MRLINVIENIHTGQQIVHLHSPYMQCINSGPTHQLWQCKDHICWWLTNTTQWLRLTGHMLRLPEARSARKPWTG